MTHRFFILASVAVVCCASLAPRAAGQEKDERARRLEVLCADITAKSLQLTDQLIEAIKQREAALRLSADAQRQLDDALRHAENAKSQRDAARTAAVSLQQKLEYETTSLRRQSEQEKEALRREAANELNAVRDRASADLTAVRDELLGARQEAASYKHELEKAQTAVRHYEAAEEADRQMAVVSYATGLDEFNRGDFIGAVTSFTAAIEAHPKDARFFYMRAMARHQVKAQEETPALDDAIADAKRGATIEQVDGSISPAVDRALARFQGKPRLWLESYRR
jgi:tetratricopeptide (TPR) repeat protein